MKRHHAFIIVVLQVFFAASAVAFSYDFVEIDYYSGEIEIETLDGNYETKNLSLILSKELHDQFFIYVQPRFTRVDDKGTAGIASVDLKVSAREVGLGIGRYFHLAYALDTYLTAGVAYNQTESDVTLDVLGYRNLIAENDTQSSQRVEVGIRWLAFDTNHIELSSYSAFQFNNPVDRIAGVALAFNLTPRAQLKFLIDVIPDEIDNGLSLGAGVRAYF